jgi:hypothetical protein
MSDSDEQTVLDYLATSPQTFFSVREVCRRAGSRDQYEENQRWAIPVLGRLAIRGLVEADAHGHYRLVPEKEY